MSKNFYSLIALISLFSVSGCGGGASSGSGTASIYQGDWLLEWIFSDNTKRLQTVGVDNNGVVTYQNTRACSFPNDNPVVKITGVTLAYADYKSLNCIHNCSYVEDLAATFSDADNVQGTSSVSATCNSITTMLTGTFTGTKLRLFGPSKIPKLLESG